MSPLRIVMLMIAAVLVSACAGPQTASRNATASAVTQQSADAAAYMPNAKIRNVIVEVPRNLTVSEANSYYPKGDIVWRGDVYGDRYEQVKALVEQGALNMARSLNGTRPVDLHIRVTRFHGLSEKARYSTGGVHNINFVMTLIDPATGTILRGPRAVVSNLDALGGRDALAAERMGNTQKVRVTGFIEQVLLAELTKPGGHVDQAGGFFVALNRSR